MVAEMKPRNAGRRADGWKFGGHKEVYFSFFTIEHIELVAALKKPS